jgi:hypothetical protein
MQAVKAIYSDGTIKFSKTPLWKGTFEVLVVLPDNENINRADPEKINFQGTPEMDKILDAEPEWKPSTFLKR